jgi:A/G-specific adenine glycosylase
VNDAAGGSWRAGYRPAVTHLWRGAIQRSVLAWSQSALRELAWRTTRDPWSVLVSEMMLQQTQVARVALAYPRFLARFPTVDACAGASQAELLEAWQGLGYNRRARHLHGIARAVVDRHGGTFPSDLQALLRLPGIGPYTARALLAFAFEQDVGVVDVNVGRVLARTEGGQLDRRRVQELADRVVPIGQGWRWNQALLDLGATVCVRRAPGCASCPLRTSCRWRTWGGPDPALGSAGESGRQSRFEGSDRQGRGRLLRALLRGPVADADLAAECGWPGQRSRAARVAQGLVRDGLARPVPHGLELA